MVEYHRTSDAPSAGQGPTSIAIVGIGGAGSNVLDRITLDRTMEATLVCMHTDVRVLSHAMAPSKIQLGTELMRGVGAGGDPDLGREAALFSREMIRQAVQGHQIIFICAGLGGGTGSGAAPVIAEIAKSTGALVLVVATMPFSFEGRRRVNQAEEALELLQKRADALILFENNRMGELILPKDGIQKAFSAADQLIGHSLRAVSTMISTPGLVKLGLDDLTAALASSNGRCLFGYGEAKGQNRGAEALKRALKSPLIDQGRLLHHTKNLLVHVAGGEGLTLVEVEGIMKQIGRNVPDHTQILFGVAVDAKLGESVSVTLISSLGKEELQAYSQAHAAPVVQAAPEVRLEPVAKQPVPLAPAAAPAPAPAPAPEPEVRAEVAEPVQEMPVAAPEVAPVSPRAAKATKPEPLDLFAVTAAQAVEEATKSVFEEVKTETVAKAPAAEGTKAEIPDEVHLAPEQEVAEVGNDVDEPPFEVDEAPEVLAPVAETAAVPLPERREVASTEELGEPALVGAEAAPARRGEGMLASVIGSSRPAKDQDHDMFQSEDEGRGRFKNTEPSLVQGEDLDVPTWMRLRKKLQR
jgi:cell division protein FtsZ